MAHDFKWRHFRGEIILWAVRWHCRYGVSYHDLEEMLEDRGIRGEVRLVERAFGIGPEMMSELMSLHGAELERIAIQRGF